jgi:hypothetical protein
MAKHRQFRRIVSGMRQIRTFVVTIVVEESASDQWHGQVTEPSDSIGWRETFVNADELSEAIKRRLITESSMSALGKSMQRVVDEPCREE